MRPRSSRSAVLTLLALLLGIGVVSVAPATAADPIPTTFTLQATSSRPHEVTFTWDISYSDGSAPSGYLTWQDDHHPGWQGYAEAPQSTGSVTEEMGRLHGDTSYTAVFHPSNGAYATAQAVAAVTIMSAETRMALYADNDGAGVVGVQAWALNDDQGHDNWGKMLLQVDGGETYEVPLGTELVAGSDGQTSLVHHGGRNIADAYVTGFPLHGEHHVRATFVPDDPSLPGATKELDVTMSMTIDDSWGLLEATSPRKHLVKLHARAARGRWSPLFAGRLVVTDLATKEKVRTFSTQDGQWEVAKKFSLRGVSAGAHRYRMTYTPARSVRDVLKGFTVTKKVVVKG